MILGDPVDPAVVADDVRGVLARPEFRYEPSLLDRLGDWLGEQIDRLLGPLQLPGGAGTFGGGAGSVIAWLIIVAAVVAVVATITYVVVNRVRRVPVDEPELTSEVEHRLPADHWAAEAERLEAEGRWKEALRARYRELVRRLVDRDQLPDMAGRTTGELREDLERSTPTASGSFDRATLRFELAWYADVPATAEDTRSFRSEAATVLEQPVIHPFDRLVGARPATGGEVGS
jgi:hypothetical protein